MKKFKKIAACAAALVCAAAMTVSASAKLTVVPQDGYTRSSDGSFLVMLYSDGTYDKSEKAVTNYGIDLTKIKTVEVTIKTAEDSTGDFGGAIIMSSKSATDASTHNWPSKDYWGITDEDLGIDTLASNKAVQFKKTGDHTYTATLELSGLNEVIKDYNFVQFAIQDWGSEIITVQSIVMKDSSGKELISFDSKGKASLPLVEEGAAAEETKAEEEKPAETTTEKKAEETTKATKKTTKATEKAPEVAEEESDADTTEEEEWVSTFDASSVAIDDAQAPYFDGLQLCLRSDNEITASYESDFGFDFTQVYGIRVNVEVDPDDVEHGVWYGGSVGANCPSRGWYQHNFANGDGDELTFVEDEGSITYMSDEPIFSADDAYAFAFFQSWGGPIGVKSFELLDADGNVLDPTAGGASVEIEEPENTAAPAPAATGTVDAAADDKGNPNTGIADVAAVAGVAAVAAGVVVLARKRK